MNIRIVLAAMILGLSLSLQSHASDSIAGDNQWYFSPWAGMNFEDTNRASNPGFALSLGLGRQIADDWTMEVSLLGGLHQGFNQLAQLGVGVDFLRTFRTSSGFSPYLLFGTGWMRTDVVEDPSIPVELEYNDPIASLGLGLVAPLGDFGNRFRGEVRYRADSEFSDLLLTVGVFRPLGGATVATRTLQDEDGDGVANDIDNCPGTRSGVKADRYGCEIYVETDSAFDGDGDGVTNGRDRCPNTPADARVDGDGCASATDSDGDGVPDHSDLCSGSSSSVKVSKNGCERDSDRDWVVDSIDSCPGTRQGARVDTHGCEIAGTIELPGYDTIELPGVMFELDSARLIVNSTSILDRAAATLRNNPGLKVEAAGYTDTTGSEAHNRDLSQRRAESVRQYLISKGANAENITARGYGQADPITDNSTRYGRRANRRVDLHIATANLPNQ